jgi:hypothetical protein
MATEVINPMENSSMEIDQNSEKRSEESNEKAPTENGSEKTQEGDHEAKNEIANEPQEKKIELCHKCGQPKEGHTCPALTFTRYDQELLLEVDSDDEEDYVSLLHFLHIRLYQASVIG